MKKIAFLFILISFLACQNERQKPIPEGMDYNDWISKEIQKEMESENIPALSIGIIRDSKIAALKNFGVMKRDHTAPVDSRSIYQIASQTKTLTGIIVNNLLSEGKLQLNEPINTYLSDVLSEEAKQRFKAITVQHILNHTAGFPRSASLVSRERKGNDYWIKGYSEENLIKDLNQMELDYKVGKKWNYSNFAYAIIGYICEKASGEDYNTLFQKYIINPYNLKDTAIKLSPEQSTRMATPYSKDNREVETKAFVMGKLSPASAAFSSIEDLTNLMLKQLKAYQLYEDNGTKDFLILTENTAQTGMVKNLDYGFGLFRMTQDNGIIYGHGGDIDGFACEYRFCPKQGVGLVFLSSSGGDWIEELFEDALMQLIKYESEKKR